MQFSRRSQGDRPGARSDAGPAAKPAARPPALRVATWWWGLAAVAMGGLAVAAFVPALRPELQEFTTASAYATLGITVAVIAVVLAWGTARLALGHLAGRLTLTGVGLIAGLPLALRGPRWWPLAAFLLLGVALLYLPSVRHYFREQVRARRAKLKADRRPGQGPR